MFNSMFNSMFNNTRKFIILSIIAISGIVSVNSLFGYKLILVNGSGKDAAFRYGESGPVFLLKGGSFIPKGFWGSYIDALDKFADLKSVAVSVSKHEKLYYDRGFLSKTFGMTPVWTEIMRHYVERMTTGTIKQTVKDIRSLDTTDTNSFVVIRFLKSGYAITFIDKDGGAIRFKVAHFRNFLGMYAGSNWYEMEEFKLPRKPEEIYADIVGAMWDITQSVKDGRVLPLTKFIEEFNKNKEFTDFLGGNIKFENELVAAEKNGKNDLAKGKGVKQEVVKKGQEGREMVEPGKELFGKGKSAGYRRVDTGFKPGVGPDKYKRATK